MAINSRKRARKREMRRYKNRLISRAAHEEIRASKGRGKHCLQCPASLICNSEGPPDTINRCKHCNRNTAVWYTHDGYYEDFGAIARKIVGVRRCPNSRPVGAACNDCRDRLLKRDIPK